MSAAPKAFMKIGEVHTHLVGDFPDLTITKLRFLEDEGLVEPERSPTGYRYYSRDHLNRLRFVLVAQRDRYLPLRVIKDQLAALDRGLTPSQTPADSPQIPTLVTGADGIPGADDFLPEPTDVRLTRAEVAAGAELTEAQIKELEGFKLLGPRPGGTYYDGAALLVAQAAGEMQRRFSIESRHLRPFLNAADREIGLISQVVTTVAAKRDPEAQARAAEAAREMAALALKLHTALVRAGLNRVLSR